MNYGFDYMDYYLPDLTSINQIINSVGYTEEIYSKILDNGLLKVPAQNDLLLTEMINIAVAKFLNSKSIKTNSIKYVFLAHSLPFLSAPDFPFFDKCFENTELKGIPSIAISGQPCSILHFATQIACLKLNELAPEDSVLLIGADKAYSYSERVFFNTVMGDAVFISLIVNNPKKNQIILSKTDTNIIAYDGENSEKEQMGRFRASNPSAIRLSILNILEEANLKISNIKYIMPHTPNLEIWKTVSTLMKIPQEKFFTKYISETGHLNSNDSFIHYTRAVSEGVIKTNDITLLINPGFGGTRGLTIIRS